MCQLWSLGVSKAHICIFICTLLHIYKVSLHLSTLVSASFLKVRHVYVISVVWLWDLYRHISQQGRDRMGSNVFPFLNKMGLSWPGYRQDSSCLHRTRLSSWRPRVCVCAHSASPPQCGCTTWLASGDLLTGAAPDRRQTSSLGSHDLSSTKPALNY